MMYSSPSSFSFSPLKQLPMSHNLSTLGPGKPFYYFDRTYYQSSLLTYSLLITPGFHEKYYPVGRRRGNRSSGVIFLPLLETPPRILVTILCQKLLNRICYHLHLLLSVTLQTVLFLPFHQIQYFHFIQIGKPVFIPKCNQYSK